VPGGALPKGNIRHAKQAGIVGLVTVVTPKAEATRASTLMAARTISESGIAGGFETE
jgi:hypothetical protein